MQEHSSLDDSSENSSTPLQKVGVIIRQKREKMNLSIDEVARSLCVGREQIKALENGAEDLLPEKVFVKAMIRRVGERLKIDSQLLIDELNKQEELNNKSGDLKEVNLNSKDLLRKVSKSFLTYSTIILLLIIASTLYIKIKRRPLFNESSPTTELNSKEKGIAKFYYHIVKPGQTLSKIASDYQITVKMLMEANSLNNPNDIKVGDRLYIKIYQSDNIKN